MRLFILVLLLGGMLPAHAEDLHYDPDGPSPEQVVAAKAKVSAFVLSMKGVNMIGVTACEKESGAPFYRLSAEDQSTKTFVHCIEMMAKTPEAALALRVLFPSGSKYSGITVACSFGGDIRL